jgi:hypothetical protein
MFVPILGPLATLVFLATLWLLVALGAAVLEESSGRIAAALKGSYGSPLSSVRAFRARPISRAGQSALPTQQWRAAA